MRLLLVDDHRIMREGLRALLAEHPDLEVVGECEDGRQAIELTAETKPDVVVMDLGMKELNGVDATRRIVRSSSHVKVVVLSTFSDEHFVFSALEAGASAYVLKINAHGELVRALHAVSRGRRFLSAEITGSVIEAGLAGSRSEGSRTPRLSSREREVLQLIAEGRTSGEIAERLQLSTRTVEQHRRHVSEKLGARGVAELTKCAIREGLVALDD